MPIKPEETFALPNTIQGINERLRELRYSIETVDAQLEDPQAKVRRGAGYPEWRARAATSRMYMVQEQRWLSDHLRGLPKQSHEDRVAAWMHDQGYTEPKLIAEAYELLKARMDLSMEDRKIVARMRNYLHDVCDYPKNK